MPVLIYVSIYLLFISRKQANLIENMSINSAYNSPLIFHKTFYYAKQWKRLQFFQKQFFIVSVLTANLTGLTFNFEQQFHEVIT